MFTQNNGYWYFRYTNSKGERKVFATGTKDKELASEIERNFVPNVNRVTVPNTVEKLLSLFLDPETNPSYMDAKITGHKYGLRHAQEVARNMRDLLKLMHGLGKFHSIPLKRLDRHNCKEIMLAIHNRWGNTSKAHDTFSQFKVCLTYAADEGWIKVSPSVGMADIHAERVTEIIPMTLTDIQTIIDRPELFRFSKKACNNRVEREREGIPEMEYAVFVLLATTGMRRGEVAALTSGQIQTGINRGKPFHYINIDRAMKDDHWSEDGIGLPKWDFSRSISIPENTYRIIEPYIGKDEDRLFDMGQSRFRTMFSRLKENALIDGVKWEDPDAFDMLTPHKLRHALNTNLLTETDLDSMLVATYLSWEHQTEAGVKAMSKVQKKYTHANASRLIKVSDTIQEWWWEDVHVSETERLAK